MRLVDELLDADILARVQDTKELLPSRFKRDANFGFADDSIEGHVILICKIMDFMIK